jgi:hypothetical protein
MDRNKVAMGVHDQQQRIMRRAAVLLVGTLVIGFYLSQSFPARANSDAPAMASRRILGVSTVEGKNSSPIHRSAQTASGRIVTQSGARD